MGFDAGDAVTPLDWDFTKFGAGQGTSPEPSDVMIERYKRQQMRIATAVIEQVTLTKAQTDRDDKEVQIVDVVPLKEAMAAISSINGDSELNRVAMQQIAEIVSTVLGNCPTV